MMIRKVSSSFIRTLTNEEGTFRQITLCETRGRFEELFAKYLEWHDPFQRAQAIERNSKLDAEKKKDWEGLTFWPSWN